MYYFQVGLTSIICPMRQINVRGEPDGWVAYVHGDRIGVFLSKADAEDGAIAWMRANPDEGGGYE